MNKLYVIAVIAICAAVTLFERAVPFLIFRGGRVPEPVRYLGGVLPMAIISTLIFYCLRGVSFSSAAARLPVQTPVPGSGIATSRQRPSIP